MFIYSGFIEINSRVIYINALILDEGTTRIQTKSEHIRKVLQTFLHELTHYFKICAKGLYDDLFVLANSFIEIPFSKYQNRRNLIESGYIGRAIDDENMADYIGDYVNRKSFWIYIINKDKGTLRKRISFVSYSIVKFIDYALSYLFGGKKKRTLLFEVEQFEKHILKIYSEVSRQQRD